MALADGRIFGDRDAVGAVLRLFEIPNLCTTCHTDKTTKWAAEELKKWPEVSHWRVAGK